MLIGSIKLSALSGSGGGGGGGGGGVTNVEAYGSSYFTNMTSILLNIKKGSGRATATGWADKNYVTANGEIVVSSTRIKTWQVDVSGLLNAQKRQAQSGGGDWLNKVNDYYGYATYLPSTTLSIANSKFGQSMAYAGQQMKTLSAEAKANLEFSSKIASRLGRVAGGVGLAINGMDILANGLNWSNGLDATFGLVSFIPGGGWVVGGSYFLLNEASKVSTGMTIGQNIEYAIWMYNFYNRR